MKCGVLFLSICVCYSILLVPISVESKRNVRTFLGLSDDEVQIERNNDAQRKTFGRKYIRSPQEPKDTEETNIDDGSDEDEDDESSTKSLGTIAKPTHGELILPPNYNRLEIPKASPAVNSSAIVLVGGLGTAATGEIQVTVHVNLRSIDEIDEAGDAMEMEMDVTFFWVDGALVPATVDKLGEVANDDIFDQREKILDPIFVKKIWKPDIFIENLISVRQPDVGMGKTARLKLAANGLITYTTRVVVRVYCSFSFEYYPADTQECYIIFRSYSHTSDVLDLKWKPPTGVFLIYPDLDDNFDFAVGELGRYRFQIQSHDIHTNETYDCLYFKVLARRSLSYHLVQTYIPSMLYIGITWLCFMVPRKVIEVRIAIAMTTLLTLTAMFASVRESTPVVSYTKAIDLWMVACIAFVFAVLLEFSLVFWTDSNKKDEEEKNKQKIEKGEELELDQSSKNEPKEDYETKEHPSIGQRLRTIVLQKATTIIDFIEDYSFILILSEFVIFLICYWTWLLVKSGYYDWNVDATHNTIGEATKEQVVEDVTFTVFADE